MTHSESIAKIAEALAAAQAKFGAVTKDKTARIASTKGTYSYTYADLASVLDACIPHLSARGIAVIQPASTEGPKATVQTWLVHSSGEWLCSEALSVVADSERPQALGSAITYARRYSLAPMIGIAPEEDDDGQAAQAKPRARAQPAEAESGTRAGELVKTAIAKDASAAEKKRLLLERAQEIGGMDDAKLRTWLATLYGRTFPQGKPIMLAGLPELAKLEAAIVALEENLRAHHAQA